MQERYHKLILKRHCRRYISQRHQCVLMEYLTAHLIKALPTLWLRIDDGVIISSFVKQDDAPEDMLVAYILTKFLARSDGILL